MATTELLITTHHEIKVYSHGSLRARSFNAIREEESIAKKEVPAVHGLVAL